MQAISFLHKLFRSGEKVNNAAAAAPAAVAVGDVVGVGGGVHIAISCLENKVVIFFLSLPVACAHTLSHTLYHYHIHTHTHTNTLSLSLFLPLISLSFLLFLCIG